MQLAIFEEWDKTNNPTKEAKARKKPEPKPVTEKQVNYLLSLLQDVDPEMISQLYAGAAFASTIPVDPVMNPNLSLRDNLFLLSTGGAGFLIGKLREANTKTNNPFENQKPAHPYRNDKINSLIQRLYV